VTELITGLDLVEWQLRVAAGEPLPLAQEAITRSGHAIEARLYAEDPARDYMPQSGRLLRFAPPDAPFVRIDGGFAQGDAVSVYYDALLAKVVVWGSDREQAVQRLAAALVSFEVAGIVTNLALLLAVARHPAFMSGDVHTGFLEEHRELLFTRDAACEERLWLLTCIGRLETRAARARGDASPWADTRAFRINEPHADVLAFANGAERFAIPVTFVRGATQVQLPGRSVSVRHARLDGDHVRCEYDGRLVSGLYVEDGPRLFVLSEGQALETRLFPSPRELADEGDGESTVKSPMPGRIHALLVGEGELVVRGQALLSLEAMKMEHTLRAPRAGRVAALQARLGEQVEEGRTLLVLAASEEA
jgi:3-methylcrotonyl-CoA carboxylase alpha subunit